MEQTINKFPKYCPGQFLSSDNLNESFNYLEEQERLSRSKLLGYGISEGLTCTCDSNKGTITITIHPGSAVTADGYLIDFPKAITYNYMASYQKNMINYDGKFLTHAYLLYETKQEIESFDQKPLTVSFNPKEYTLGIVVETKEEKSVKCNQKSCNVNNSNIIITYRPVLIRKYIPDTEGRKIKIILPNLKEMNIFPTPLTDVKTNRLQKIIESRDLNVLSRKKQTLYHNNESLIVKALNGLSTTVNTQILNEEAKIAFTKYFSKPISKLGDFNYELSIMNKECPYCLLFLEDVKTAINEFVVFYNDYSKNYSFYTNTIQKDKLIILGDGTSNDKYRNIFRYACSDQCRINDCNIVSNLFIRIPKLIESFAGRNISNTVRLIPARDCSSKLEERPIPYYYNSTIHDFWKTGLPGTTPAAYHYFNFNPEFLSRHFEGVPFFRIEGAYGQNVNVVYDKLTDLIETYDLPIKVAKMELVKPVYLNSKNIQKLNELFTKAKASSSGGNNSIRSDILKLSAMINLNQNYDIKLHELKISTEKVNEAYQLLSKINRQQFTSYYYLLSQKTPAGESYKEPTIAALSHLNSIVTQILVKNYRMAEYLGGGYRNSTLILLYYKGLLRDKVQNRVIMDITIPGYLEENEEKSPKVLGF